MSGSFNALKVAIPSPLNRLFEYLPPLDQTRDIAIGARVRVPFGVFLDKIKQEGEPLLLVILAF